MTFFAYKSVNVFSDCQEKGRFVETKDDILDSFIHKMLFIQLCKLNLSQYSRVSLLHVWLCVSLTCALAPHQILTLRLIRVDGCDSDIIHCVWV